MRTERRLLRLVRPYWGLLAAGIVVTFLASVLDGFVLVVLIPLLKNLFGKPEAVSEHGAVKWFDAQKGFGFIERPDGSDIFVHYSDIVGSGFRTLTEGQKVQFEVSQSPKGQQAVKVTRLD